MTTSTLAQLEFDEASHQYSVNGKVYPSVTQVLQSAGLTPDSRNYTPGSAERGTYVHQITAMIDRDELDRSSVDPRLAGYVEAYDKFVKQCAWRPRMIEQKAVSMRYGFAGCLDREGALSGAETILDIKTGAYARWHDIQLGGYEVLYEENFLGTPWPKIEKRAILQLGRDGSFKVIAPQGLPTTARSVFLAALALHRWKER